MAKNYFVCYVAGPISKGPIMENVRQAFEAANELLLEGIVPVVPHSTVFWNWMYPPKEQKNQYLGDHELWLPYDRAFLEWADCLLRLPGYSYGSVQEVTWMREMEKPVYYDVESVIIAYKAWKAGKNAREA